jgi:hypothetical protein
MFGIQVTFQRTRGDFFLVALHNRNAVTIVSDFRLECLNNSNKLHTKNMFSIWPDTESLDKRNTVD